MSISKTGGLIAAASKDIAKPNIQLGSITAVKRIVLTFQEAGIFPIVVITGVEAYEVQYQLANRGVIFLYNENYMNNDMFDSVCLGLSFLKDDCERVIFSPVNMPLFLPSTLKTIMNIEADAVIPLYQQQAGHPILISKDIIPDILTHSGAKGLNDALSAIQDRCCMVDVNDEGILFTLDDLDELRLHLKEHSLEFIHPYLQLSVEQEKVLFNARTKLLLYLIAKTHSVRAASRQMALAYSNAWEMLNRLERAFGYPFIIRKQGGPKGSRSELTPQGYRFIHAYQQYEENLQSYTSSLFDEFIRDSVLNPPVS
jgi:molybdate transport repressor ModE-like protein